MGIIKLGYIISNDKSKLEAINKKINDYMIANIENYSADKWGDITKHPTKQLWYLKINDDTRKPNNLLKTSEKLEMINDLSVDWIKKDLGKMTFQDPKEWKNLP